MVALRFSPSFFHPPSIFGDFSCFHVLVVSLLKMAKYRHFGAGRLFCGRAAAWLKHQLQPLFNFSWLKKDQRTHQKKQNSNRTRVRARTNITSQTYDTEEASIAATHKPLQRVMRTDVQGKPQWRSEISVIGRGSIGQWFFYFFDIYRGAVLLRQMLIYLLNTRSNEGVTQARKVRPIRETHIQDQGSMPSTFK